MSAQAGDEIPRSEVNAKQPTPLSASGSDGERGTGINWREVLGQSPSKVEQTSYA